MALRREGSLPNLVHAFKRSCLGFVLWLPDTILEIARIVHSYIYTTAKISRMEITTPAVDLVGLENTHQIDRRLLYSEQKE